ncbi:hypothetical protein TorRG33x02_119880, partial [Trema orientale]
MAKTRRIEVKKSSSKTAGTSSAGKKTKSPSKSLAKTPMPKPTIPEQNTTDLKGKSAVEATYEEAKIG